MLNMYLMTSYHIFLLPISHISLMRWKFMIKFIPSAPDHGSLEVIKLIHYLASCLPIASSDTLS